jgi:hypothetical protein
LEIVTDSRIFGSKSSGRQTGNGWNKKCTQQKTRKSVRQPERTERRQRRIARGSKRQPIVSQRERRESQRERRERRERREGREEESQYDFRGLLEKTISEIISMPIKKYYQMYKQLKQYGGNSEHYDKIVRASRDHYHRKMLDPEYREQQRIKALERYYKRKELKGNAT